MSRRSSVPSDEEGGAESKNSADQIRWIGDPLKSSAQRDFYRAISIDQGREVIKMRDDVMVEAGDGREPYLARCIAMWEDKRTGIQWMRTQWYFRAEDLPQSALDKLKDFPHVFGKGGLRKREVFQSTVSDDNDLRALLGKVTVVNDLAEFSKLQKNAGGTKVYLCRFSYNQRDQMVQPVAGLPEAAAEKQKPRKRSKPSIGSPESSAASPSISNMGSQTTNGGDKSTKSTKPTEPAKSMSKKPKQKANSRRRGDKDDQSMKEGMWSLYAVSY